SDLQVRQSDFVVPAETATWQKRALVVGVVGAILCVIGGFLQTEQFLRGYLMGFMLWLGLSLGCLAFLMVQYLSGGLAFLSIRRSLEAAAQCIPLMLVLFLPILLGRHHLYEWMNDAALTVHNRWYLNTP